MSNIFRTPKLLPGVIFFLSLFSILFVVEKAGWSGGPAQVTAAGTPMIQSNATTLQYNPDPGPLQSSGPEGDINSCGGGNGGSGGCGSSSIMPWREAHAAGSSNADAIALSDAAWSVWNNSGANVNVTKGPALSEDVTVCNADKFIDAQTNFTADGCDPRMCGNIVPKPACCTVGPNNPIIYDPTGDLIASLAGENLRTQVLASTAQVPWPATNPTGYAGFNVIINGVCLEDNADQHPSCKRADGSVIKWTAADLAVTMAHEFGHGLGLTHTQVNPDCILVLGPGDAQLKPGCDVNKVVPLMYPFALNNAAAPATLNADDIANIKHLYPKAGDVLCKATGNVFSTPPVGSFNAFAGGPNVIRGAEVILRPINGGLDQFKDAVSGVSGLEVANDGLLTGGHAASQCTEADHNNCGRFVIDGLKPNVNYCVDVKKININFSGGSRYGPLDPPFQSIQEITNTVATCPAANTINCPAPGGAATGLGLSPQSKFLCDPNSSSCN